MKIERERGISVSASVMTFEHDGLMFNLLDTPGHEDFSEDTYRTLTAADAAIMVLDAAKGIEPQTLKLFEVCRLRDIPIITFINKMDREAQDPFELLDEIAVQAGSSTRRRSTGRPERATASRAWSSWAPAGSCPTPRKTAGAAEDEPTPTPCRWPTPSQYFEAGEQAGAGGGAGAGRGRLSKPSTASPSSKAT